MGSHFHKLVNTSLTLRPPYFQLTQIALHILLPVYELFKSLFKILNLRCFISRNSSNGGELHVR